MRLFRGGKSFGHSFIAALMVLSIWQVSIVLWHVPPYLLPPPSEVVREGITFFPLVARNTTATLEAILLGFLGSIVGGMLLGVAIVYVKLLESSIMPIVLFFQVVPKVAIAPLLIVWLGVGSLSKMAMVFLISFFPILVATVSGLRSINEDIVMLAKSTGATRWRVFAQISLPNALPYLFSGLRVAITLAVMGTVVAEFVASNQGLGYVIMVAFSRTDTALVMAALLALTMVGMVLYGAIVALESMLIPWHASQRHPQHVDVSVVGSSH